MPASSPTPTPTPTPLTTSDVFTGIEDHIARNPALADKIGKSFLFKLTSPDATWTLDLKTAPGSVRSGGTSADCVLELADADFLAMTAGKADPMKLYMSGKLKVTGDVMASQRLTFLQKIDPKAALEAIQRKRAGAAAPPKAPRAAAPREPKAPALFKSLAERLAKAPSLAREVGAVLQFDVTSPDASWVVDLTAGGTVREGKDARASAVFRVSDEDLALLSRDPARARDLFQRGKLRVDGDLAFARKLSFLEGLSPASPERGRDLGDLEVSQ